MQNIQPVARENTSDAVADALRAMIVDGILPAGERINEVHLAQKLGVSRTPLREALARLSNEGALNAIPRIGYFVRPLTLDEFEQIYDLRPLLDPEALRLSGIPSSDRLDALDKLNRKIAATRDARAAIDLDDRWHLGLVAECPNKVLIEMIENIIRRCRRYDIVYMRENRNVSLATEEHARILAALRKGDLSAACAALKQNMQSGRDPIAAWLKRRVASKGP